jgi:hypothetical protein
MQLPEKYKEKYISEKYIWNSSYINFQVVASLRPYQRVGTIYTGTDSS